MYWGMKERGVMVPLKFTKKSMRRVAEILKDWKEAEARRFYRRTFLGLLMRSFNNINPSRTDRESLRIS